MANNITVLHRIYKPEVWESLPRESWQQTFEYGQIHKHDGRSVYYYTIQQDGQTAGYMTLVLYRFFGSYTFGYIPYGPVVLAPWSQETMQQYKQELQEIAHANHCVFIRHDTELSIGRPVSPSLMRASFHQPRGEGSLSLAPDIGQIKSTFSKSTRRNINKSLKTGLGINHYHGEEMLAHKEDFIELNITNVAGHGTTTHSTNYFHAFFNVLSENPDNFLSLVCHSDRVVAAHLITSWKSGRRSLAYCPFGASSDMGKSMYAYYFLKYHTMEYLQSVGVSHWNWGGISISEYDSYLKGVDQFKRGFGVETIEHGTLQDLVYHYPLYWIYCIKKLVS